MSLNHETLAWLINQERNRQVALLERERLLDRVRPALSTRFRRGLGRRLMAVGARIADLSATESSRATGSSPTA